MAFSLTGRSLPYFQQPHPQSCGASCLKMLYDHWGISVEHDEIWDSVRARSLESNVFDCHNYLMALDALKRGCHAAVVTTSHPLSLIQSCHKENIEVIVLYRPKDESPTHYLLVVSYNEKTDLIQVNDPIKGEQRGKNARYTSKQFLHGMRRIGSSMQNRNIMLLVSHATIPTCEFLGEHAYGIPVQSCVKAHAFFEPIYPLVTNVLCLEHDIWVSVPS